MEKVVVPLATRRPANQPVTWFECPAIPALGLAGPDLMIPCPVEAENTAPCRLDDGGSLLDWLADEDVTSRQASLIIGFTVITYGGVGACARWTRIRRVLTRAVSLRGAVRGFARALGNFMSYLIAAVTPNLGIRLLRGPLNGSGQLLVLLLHLSLGSHKGGDYF